MSDEPTGPTHLHLLVPDLRRRVIDASAELVSERGLDALSMREVARRAGVSHQAPYHHFGDREGILASLVEEGFRELADALEHALSGPGDAAERLTASGRAYVRSALRRPGHFRVMFRPDLVPLERWPGARAEAERAHGLLSSAVRACADEGLVHPDEVELVVATAWSTVHGLAVLLLDGPLAADAEGLAERVPTVLSRLLQERRPAPRR